MITGALLIDTFDFDCMRILGSFPDHAIGEMLIADYILFFLNQRRNFKYCKFLKLDEPSDCITTVLTKGAVNLGHMITLKSSTGGNAHFHQFHVQFG